MKLDPPPIDLPPEEADLEGKLRRMRPSALPVRMRDATLRSLEVSETELAGEDASLEREMGTRLRAAQPRSGLWDEIEARLTPGDSGLNQRVVTVPQWQDFMPIFKLAAVVALGLFVASMWLRPESGGELPSAQNQLPHRDIGKVQPVSHRGVFQGVVREGVMKKNQQFYEIHRETRRDRALYQLDGDIRVEDDVSRSRRILKPLRTL